MVKARELAHGINRRGRSATISYKKRYLHFKKGPQKTEEKKVEKKPRESRWYPAEDVPHPLKSRKNHRRPTKLRSSITPGTILIVLAGRFKGKRVVFLKQLTSGLLLVSGPYKVNGVPLRRINQAYVIATSTKVDTSKVDLAKINDKLFKRHVYKVEKKGAKKDAKKDEKKDAKKDEKKDQFFKTAKKKKNVLSAERKAAQKRIDGPLFEAVNAIPTLKHYLSAKFSLTNGVFPHAVKF